MGTTLLDCLTMGTAFILLVPLLLRIPALSGRLRDGRSSRNNKHIYSLCILFTLTIIVNSIYLISPRTSTLVLLPSQRVIEPPIPEMFFEYPSRARPGETLEMTMTVMNLNELHQGEAHVHLEDRKTGRSIATVFLSADTQGTDQWNFIETMPREDLTIEITASHWSWMGDSIANVKVECAGLDLASLLLLGDIVAISIIVSTVIKRKKRCE